MATKMASISNKHQELLCYLIESYDCGVKPCVFGVKEGIETIE
jgi:hypothetical protein